MRNLVIMYPLFLFGCANGSRSSLLPETSSPLPARHISTFDVTRMVEIRSVSNDAFSWCFPPDANLPGLVDLDDASILAFRRIHQALVDDSIFPQTDDEEVGVRPNGSVLPDISLFFREVVDDARAHGTPVFVSSDQAISIPLGNPKFVSLNRQDYDQGKQTTPGAYIALRTRGIVQHKDNIGLRIEFSRDYYKAGVLASGQICFVPQADGALKYTVRALLVQ